MNSFRLLAIAAAAWIACSASVFAQSSSGFLGKSRSEYLVYVFGDSLAAGLWAGSQRIVEDNPRLKVKGRFKEGSGLARPQVHDWAEALPRIIESNPMHVAVIMVGANDRQDVRQVDETLEFGSDKWREYYSRRVDQLLGVLKSNGIAVYWVELPPMGPPDLDAAAKIISGIHKEQVAKARMRFVEIRKDFANEDGSYTDKGFDVSGEFKRLRSRNGIQFLRDGNTKVAKIVMDEIGKDIEVSDGVREPDPAIAASPVEDDYGEKPIFGHSLNSGEAFVLEPGELPRSDAIAIARRAVARATTGESGGATAETVLEALRSSAIPGSAAGRLFVDGEWPEAPAGRIDNFAWPAQ
jgi:hypothetical protein